MCNVHILLCIYTLLCSSHLALSTVQLRSAGFGLHPFSVHTALILSNWNQTRITAENCRRTICCTSVVCHSSILRGNKRTTVN